AVSLIAPDQRVLVAGCGKRLSKKIEMHLYASEEQHLPRHEIAFRAQEEIDYVRNVLEPAESRNGLALEQSLDLVLRHAANEIGLDRDGPDGVHRDAERCELAREHRRQALNGRFR